MVGAEEEGRWEPREDSLERATCLQLYNQPCINSILKHNPVPKGIMFYNDVRLFLSLTTDGAPTMLLPPAQIAILKNRTVIRLPFQARKNPTRIRFPSGLLTWMDQVQAFSTRNAGAATRAAQFEPPIINCSRCLRPNLGPAACLGQLRRLNPRSLADRDLDPQVTVVASYCKLILHHSWKKKRQMSPCVGESGVCF